MALIRWIPRGDLFDPFANLVEIQEEVNRLFNSTSPRAGRRDGEDLFVPPVDVTEEKDSFLVKADLPGLAKDDVSVTLQNNYLTIRGERKHEAETREANYQRRERVYGMFTRTIELPSSVDAKKIDAHFKDGVLQVRLPKTEEAKPRQIEVKVS